MKTIHIIAIFSFAFIISHYAGILAAKDMPSQDYEATREEIIPVFDDYEEDEEQEQPKQTSNTTQTIIKSTSTEKNSKENNSTEYNTKNTQKKQDKKKKKSNAPKKAPYKKNITKDTKKEQIQEKEKPQLQPIWLDPTLRKSIVKFFNRNKGKTYDTSDEDYFPEAEKQEKKKKLVVLRCKKGCSPPPGALPVEEENLPSDYIILEKYDCWHNSKECEPGSLLLL